MDEKRTVGFREKRDRQVFSAYYNMQNEAGVVSKIIRVVATYATQPCRPVLLCILPTFLVLHNTVIWLLTAPISQST